MRKCFHSSKLLIIITAWNTRFTVPWSSHTQSAFIVYTGHYPVRSYWHQLITSRFKHVLLITLIIKFPSACWVKHCARCGTRHRVFNLWTNPKFAIAMPRIKYLKGSLRSNFISCNVARENAPCTGTSLSYQLHSPRFHFLAQRKWQISTLAFV